MRRIFPDRYLTLLFIGGFLAQLFLWILTFYFVRASNVPFTLHYTVLRGVDLIGEYRDLYKIPLIASIIFLINSVVAFLVYRKDSPYVSYLVLGAAFVATVFLGIALRALLLINFF